MCTIAFFAEKENGLLVRLCVLAWVTVTCLRGRTLMQWSIPQPVSFTTLPPVCPVEVSEQLTWPVVFTRGQNLWG